MKKEWQDLLLKSFEETLSQVEAKQLANALKTSPELQKEKADLLKIRRLFSNFSIEEDDQFVSKIMEGIGRKELVAKRQIMHHLSIIYSRAVAACILILMSFIIYIYLSEGNFETETLVGITDLSPDEAYSFLIEE